MSSSFAIETKLFSQTDSSSKHSVTIAFYQQKGDLPPSIGKLQANKNSFEEYFTVSLLIAEMAQYGTYVEWRGELSSVMHVAVAIG